MKHNLTTGSSKQLDQLGTIWSIVEARQRFPAIIVITSATDIDDTMSVARGLASVANSAGRRTGYLELAGANATISSQTPYVTLSIGSRGSEREEFDAAAASWRTAYDVVIVNAPNSIAGSLRAQAARLSDAVVIGLTDQRRVAPADRALVLLLDELKANVLGVVVTGRLTKTSPLKLSHERSLLKAAPQP